MIINLIFFLFAPIVPISLWQILWQKRKENEKPLQIKGFSLALQKMQTSPVAVPGIFLADGAASSSADRGHSLRSLGSATGGAPVAPLCPCRKQIASL